MFYSFEVNTFDEEIVALLASMADNISFALNNFQNAQERRDTTRVLRESEERFRSCLQTFTGRWTPARASKITTVIS